MAEKHSRGWIWSREDRLPPSLALVARRADHVAAQVSRIKQALPEFSASAVGAADEFLVAAGKLAGLWASRRNKYRPISPQEAADLHARLQSGLSAWNGFLARPDVREAIRRVNRETRAKSDAARQEMRQALGKARAKLGAGVDSLAFRSAFAASIQEIVEASIAVVVLTSKDLIRDEGDGALLKEAAMLRFVQMLVWQSESRRLHTRAVMSRQPQTPPMDVICALSLLMVREDIARLDLRNPLLSPESLLGAPGGIIAMATAGLIRQSLVGWLERGLSAGEVQREEGESLRRTLDGT